MSVLAAAVLCLATFGLAGCGGGDDSGSGAGTATASGPGAGPGGAGPGGAGPGMPPGGFGGGMGGMGSGGPIMGGPPMGGGAPGGGQAVASSKPENTTPPPGARPDPFAPWWPPPPPPPAITLVEPIRLAKFGTGKPEEVGKVEIREVPNRRVSGILTGTSVLALLEGPGSGPIVVRPGQEVDGYTVESINADSVTLVRRDGNRTFKQIVPLTDVGSLSGGGGPPAGLTGPPGMPGMGVPGSLFPGAGPPGLGGGAGRFSGFGREDE